MKNRVLLGALVLFAGAVVLVGAMGGTDDVVVAPVVPVETTTSTTTTTTTTTTTVPPPRTAILAFTGDLLAHGPVQSAAAAYATANPGAGSEVGSGYDFRPMFDEVSPIISAVDLAICHIETPLR